MNTNLKDSTAAELKRRREELALIATKPFRELNPELLAWLRREVPAWKNSDPEGDATYCYGLFAVDGSFVDKGRKRMTGDESVIRRLASMPTGHLQLDEPKPGSTREMAQIQQIKGEFTLTICGVPIPVKYAENVTMVQNPLTLRMEERPIVRPIVLEKGLKTVSPTFDPDLFAFMELHPDRWGSPSRSTDAFQAALGSPVLCDIRIDATQATFRRGMSIDIQEAALITDSEDMRQLSMVAQLDDATLGRIGFDTGFHRLAGANVSLRDQLIAHAGNILKDKTPQNKYRRDRVLAELSPDNVEAEKTTRQAADVGVLVPTIIDGLGAYLLDGEQIAGYTYNSENVGREIDALITEMRFRQDYPLIHRIASAGREAASSEQGKAATFAKHDALIARLHGEGIAMTCDSSGGENYCCWVVVDKSEKDPHKWQKICKYKSVNMKRPDKIDVLIEWGRTKGSYDNLLSLVEEMVGKRLD